MACLVLPSEIARLVYGYLMKEKLDNIALQFLENSPYLTDCYHIVKNGYQFNTKFLYKELHELIQEYSSIQNLVNKKISLLSKSSSLYKNIKLQCENLSEIIDMILFWRCNELEYEGNTLEEIKSKNGTHQAESRTDKINEMTVNSNNDILAQGSECSEYVSSSTPRNDKVMGENEEMFEENEYRLTSKFSNDSNETNSNMNCVVENINVDDVGTGMNSEVTDNYNEIQGEKENNISEVTKDNSEMNISLSNLDQSNSDKSNKIEISLIPNEQDVVNVNGQIKVVRVEKDNHENEEKNQLSNAFVQHLDGMESGLNMENGSVFYVSPDVGNITINQDRNQIIVIPIDYPKPQTSCQSEIGNEQVQSQNMISNEGSCIDANSGIIFEDIPVASNSAPVTTPSAILPFCGTFVDDNIVTESTYLKNKGLIYELESKVKPQIFQEPPPIKVAPPAPAPVQTIVWSQVIENPDTRNRRILPKASPSMQNTPVVVVQPLIKKNRVFRAIKPKVKQKRERCTRKKNVKDSGNTSVEANEVKEVLTMPSIRTPSHEGGVQNECTKVVEESVKEVQTSTENSENINEERVNLVMSEKKTETPVVVLNKNPKRLSFSTPRRKSHIRALEFETPPKSGNAKKKSRTSPKVKVEELKVTKKNVRNTLFKSPDLDTIFKTPACLKGDKKCSPDIDNSTSETQDQTLALPLDTTTLISKSDVSWSGVAGVSCLNKGSEKRTGLKKSWDADLRDLISSGISAPSDNVEVVEKKRSRRRGQKNDKKSNKKKQPSPKKVKVAQVIPSPSKISLTAKRNTYSISGNEEGSPVRSLLEELDLVTPFKDSEPVRDVEETPITKFLRENVNGLDIDLNMLNTPIFPPTPSIVITPDCDDSLPITGTYYYTPIKDTAKERITKIEGPTKTDEDIQAAESVRKKGAKETHEKVIGELVSKAKEIIGLKAADKEEATGTKPLSGKVLSMVKIQMITQCDKKLYENIPINEEPIDEGTEVDQTAEDSRNFDLKRELEEKRQRALRKIKSVKENFGDQNKRRKVKKSPVKRKIGEDAGRSRKRFKRVSVNDSSTSEEKDLSGIIVKEAEIFHSTPVEDRSQSGNREDSKERVDRSMLDEIREEFPCFQDDGEFSELPLKTRKKLHYVKHFLKSDEISRFLENNERKTLKLKRSHRKFFQVFYKWLRHPHARELNISERSETIFKEYRSLFEKIKTGVSLKVNGEECGNEDGGFSGIHSQFSDDDTDTKYKANENKKEEDPDDGPVSVLPLKKRKATVQPSQPNEVESGEKSHATESPSRTQTLLQDIDVDRFLSQIHGQENR